MLHTGAAVIISGLHKALEGFGHCRVWSLLPADRPHLLLNALHQKCRKAWP